MKKQLILGLIASVFGVFTSEAQEIYFPGFYGGGSEHFCSDNLPTEVAIYPYYASDSVVWRFNGTVFAAGIDNHLVNLPSLSGQNPNNLECRIYQSGALDTILEASFLIFGPISPVIAVQYDCNNGHLATLTVLNLPGCDWYVNGMPSGNGKFAYTYVDSIANVNAIFYGPDVCVSQASITINPRMPIVPNVTSNDVTCNGDNNGSTSITVSGGISPYTYLWNNGSTSSVINNLTAGTYIVTITDANGCTATAFNSIIEPGPAIIAGPDTVCRCGGDVLLQVLNPEPGYTYTWKKVGQNNPIGTGVSKLITGDGLYYFVSSPCGDVSQKVKVYGGDVPLIVTGNNTPQATLTAPSKATFYKWYRNGSLFASGANMYVLVDTVPGKFKCWMYYGTDSCKTKEMDIKIKNPAPRMENLEVLPSVKYFNNTVLIIDNCEVVIFNYVGQTIVPSKNYFIGDEVDLSLFSSGIYLITASSKSGKLTKLKILKQ